MHELELDSRSIISTEDEGTEFESIPPTVKILKIPCVKKAILTTKKQYFGN